MQNHKVLVIGSNSFSGSDFIQLLLEHHCYKVIGVSRSQEKRFPFLSYLEKKNENFTFVQIDMNRNLKALTDLIDTFEPEYIVNFAAQSEVAPSWQYPHHWFETNVVSLAKLIHHLKDKTFLKKYLHISSPEVYGNCVGTISENASLNPSTPYAASKAAADLLLMTYFKNYNFPIVLIRSTNVYGAYQQLFKIIPRTMISILNNKKILLHGGGVAVKSYIHIKDISRGELLAMHYGRIGEIYHLSANSGVAIKDVVSQIAHLMGTSLQDVALLAPERLGQDGVYIIDSKKAQEELQWSPQISLDAGLKQTLEWIKVHFHTIKNEPLEYVHKE